MVPKPREFFPFTARVELCGGWPLDRVTASNLMEIFAEYNPTAAGTGRTRQRSGVAGFISLPSLAALDQFIANVHGKSYDENEGHWEAVSMFDPALTSARTAEELEEFKNTRLQETIIQKRQLRQQKKLEQNSGNCPVEGTPVTVAKSC